MSPATATDVDPSIWRACAGTSVEIPAVDSKVYYFPQGHAEQSSSSPSFSSLVSFQPCVLCRLLSVRFLANPSTDEVFSLVRLVPIPPSLDTHLPCVRYHQRSHSENDEEDEGSVVVSFAKVLTPSDANNGGGFSVPRFCADSIFPALDYAAEPPVQNLLITDVHGVTWQFRHIYRGTPRRHLLTTGWSKFVNSKKLIAGDSVVFMRDSKTGGLFVGVRRAVRANADSNGRWNCPLGSAKARNPNEQNNDDSNNSNYNGIGGGGGDAREGIFTRNGRGRVSAEEVARAAELAVRGMEFEVVYYPSAASAEFVVDSNVVEESLNVYWTAGMRVKMPMDTEDSSRVTWLQGTVASTMFSDNGLWRGSPWRMLQVTWDEPEVLQNVKRVSPWQVEYVVTSPPLHSSFPPAKKFQIPQIPGLLPDGEGELIFPMAGLTNSIIGHLNPPLMNYTSFPAGMQGARQDHNCASCLSNFMSDNTHQVCNDYCVGNMIPKLKPVCTELNIGSPQSDNLSPDSQSSVHFFGTDVVGKCGCNSPMKVGISSFQLFGKVIHMKDPVDGGFDDGCTEDEASNKESEDVNNQLDLSLTYPCMKLIDRLDGQCQRASAVEACTM